MKTKALLIAVSLVTALGLSNCTTTYDAYGRPVQSVDPGLATAGIIGAGVLGYALANDNDDHHRHHRHHRHHYRRYRH
ncbi:hypothetical protein Rhal01_03197 [Rubritalea halochordaticola]|uniref:Uncharacterized protein n=1 Tax=Rubritalea halochordaticola TaxID=714537 RepID=A0ABP9V2W7_9BACT